MLQCLLMTQSEHRLASAVSVSGLTLYYASPRPPHRWTMRLLLLLVAICVGFVGTGRNAEAQNYPWCAYLGTGFDSTNCGFTTFHLHGK
jgi:hypothetical protein